MTFIQQVNIFEMAANDVANQLEKGESLSPSSDPNSLCRKPTSSTSEGLVEGAQTQAHCEYYR